MLDTWEEYIEDLCRRHTDIRHDKEDGKKKRRCFVPYIDDETPVVHSDLASPYVVHAYFGAASNKDTQWTYLSSLQVVVNVADKGNTSANINAARNKAFAIAEDLEAKIREDADDGDKCALLDNLVSTDLTPFGVVDQRGYGWTLNIRWTQDRKEVNLKKWSDQ